MRSQPLRHWRHAAVLGLAPIPHPPISRGGFDHKSNVLQQQPWFFCFNYNTTNAYYAQFEAFTQQAKLQDSVSKSVEIQPP
jgi:hypothetical protein